MAQLFFRIEADRIVIFGQTYPHRDAIKALGARFNGTDKTWYVTHTPAHIAHVRALVEEITGIPAIPVAAAPVATPVIPSTISPNISSSSGVPPWVLSSESLADTLPPWDLSDSVKSESLPLREPRQSLRLRPIELEPPQNSASLLSQMPAEIDKKNEGLTVSQLMASVQTALARGFPQSVWVIGEVQNVSWRNGHCYFQLAESKDGAAEVATVTVKATLWANTARDLNRAHSMKSGLQNHSLSNDQQDDKVRELLQDGMKIRCLTRVTLYKDRGQISLVIEDLDPSFTKGDLALARERLLKELRSKGLERKNKNLRLGAFPLRVGLISAFDSRAYSDFVHQLTEHSSLKFPGILYFASAPMQGDQVPTAVCAAMDLLLHKGCDVIVLTRGGGSAADLRWFDDRSIAYKIAECPVPVIAAIGHHDDVCVAEEICFQREKTPTAAAQFILEWFQGTRLRLNDIVAHIADVLLRRLDQVVKIQSSLSQQLASGVTSSIVARQEILTNSAWNLQNSAIRRLASLNLQAIQSADELARAGQEQLSKRRDQLQEFEKAFLRIDPRPWLKRGWTQLMSKSKAEGEKLILSVDQLSVDEQLSARLLDGSVELVVRQTQKILNPSNPSKQGEV